MMRTKETDRLRKKLQDAIGKYCDYQRYWITLSNLEEEYALTNMRYREESWKENSEEMICQKASRMLEVTIQIFQDLLKNGETELISVVEEIMECGAEEQKKIWGTDLFVDKNKIDREILEEIIFEWSAYLDEDERVEGLVETIEAFLEERAE